MAEALNGRWYAEHGVMVDMIILVPVLRWADWEAWLRNREPGEPSSILPDWVLVVPRSVVITEVEIP